MTQDDPLTDEELDALGELLLDRVDESRLSEGSDEGVLDISELDGFLTAVVSGPVTLLPSRWLPALWGDFEPQWESIEEHEAFLSLLIRHSNNIIGLLMNGPDDFEPIFLERRRGGRVHVVVDDWCEGYMRGVHLISEAWRSRGVELHG